MFNKVLQDRLLMFSLSFEPDTDSETEYVNSIFYRTLQNVSMITQAFWEQKRSFVLNFKLLRKLITSNETFETYDQALDFVKEWEATSRS